MSEAKRAPDWRDRIVADPAVLGGKAAIRGTRVAVETILECLAAGWTVQQVLEAYPFLDEDAIQAALSYAAEVVRDDAALPLAAPASQS